MRLLLAGNVMLGRLVNDALRQRPPESPWGDTLPLLRAADASICNLDCVLANGGAPWSATKNVAGRRASTPFRWPITTRSTTATTRPARGWRCWMPRASPQAGAGCMLEEAMRPAVFAVGGTRIALLACTDNEPEWEAAPDRAGTFYVPIALSDPLAERVFTLVRRTKADADLVVVALYWGANWGDAPVAHIPCAAR